MANMSQIKVYQYYGDESMKKLLSLLTIGTLTSTTISNVNAVINTNLNQQSTNKVNDVLLPNSSEITGYTGDIKNYKIDLFGNVFYYW